jgi:hypothetical protein
MSGNTPKPDKIKKPERQPYLNIILGALPLISSLMLFVALMNLGTSGGGMLGIFKPALISLAAFLVSYAIYRMAIEKAATLVSVGFNWAAAVGVLSMLIVGVGLFSATYPGLVITEVEERSLQQFVSDTGRYIDKRNASASQSGGLVPVMAAIPADLKSKADCEISSNCVSLKGTQGYGAVAKTLETLAGRAETISLEVAAGLTTRADILAELAALSARMEAILADENLSIWKRRTDIRKLDGELGQILNRLDDAIPVSLIVAYSAELRAGINIPNRPDVSATINGFLRGYAASLDAVLAEIGADETSHPAFPPRSGAIQTFAYIGEYIPIAILTFAVELVFPITLWAYTLMSLIWVRYQNNPDGDDPAPRDRHFDDLTNIRAVEVPKHLNAPARQDAPLRHINRNHRNGGN